MKLPAGFFAIALVMASPLAGAQERVNPDALAVKEFIDRVNEYVALRQRVEGEVPKLKETSDPAKISERERMLGQAIAAARAGAKPGDIFTPTVAKQFRTIIQQDLNRRSRREVNAALEEVPKKMPVTVNQVYPTTEALATVPPLLLARLQPLPEPLEYRFMGRGLILHDTEANLIIDFIPDVLPSRGR